MGIIWEGEKILEIFPQKVPSHIIHWNLLILVGRWFVAWDVNTDRTSVILIFLGDSVLTFEDHQIAYTINQLQIKK